MVFCKFIGGSLFDFKYLVDSGIYVVNLKNDIVEKVVDSGYNVYFVGDNECIFFIELVGGKVYYEM